MQSACVVGGLQFGRNPTRMVDKITVVKGSGDLDGPVPLRDLAAGVTADSLAGGLIWRSYGGWPGLCYRWLEPPVAKTVVIALLKGRPIGWLIIPASHHVARG